MWRLDCPLENDTQGADTLAEQVKLLPAVPASYCGHQYPIEMLVQIPAASLPV